MVLTIHQDAIGNKYIGYAGDLANIALATEVFQQGIIDLLNSFPSTTAESGNTELKWRTDGSLIDPDSAYFYSLGVVTTFTSPKPPAFSVNSRDVDPTDLNNFHLTAGESSANVLDSNGRAVAVSNGIDCGFFAWDINNISGSRVFIWVGEVKGNSNISRPQTRSGIAIIPPSLGFTSFGVKQGDSTTKRIHLDTEAGASHNIDCAEETGRLFLIEDDGAGGDGGTVGYCENLYISKQTGLTIGGFVTLNGITDGGSTHGIVVGDWGTDAKIIMRVYDGTN